jgi:hypothetical protein
MPGPEGVLLVNDSGDIELPGPGGIKIRIRMRYRILETPDSERKFKVTTLGYGYRLWAAGEKTIDYHWHPFSDSHETRPHAHLPAFPRCHIPTGRVMIEDVLRLAVELGATPVDPAHWDEVDNLNRRNFALSASWGVGSNLVLPPGAGAVPDVG